MDLLLAVLVYPALLLLVGLGTGLLVERLSGFVLPPALLPAVGTAGLIGFTQLTTIDSLTAPATPWLVLAVAIAGFVVARVRLRELRADRSEWVWPLLAFLAAFAVAVAPVALSGRVTLTRYLLDTTSSVQLLGAERILDHGRHFSTAAPTAANGYLQIYFGIGYPAGAHTLFGATGKLVPLKLIWLYQPFLAYMEALVAPVLWFLGRRLFGLGRAAAAALAFLAAVPALVYAYQLMGAIKEITALPAIVLVWALIVDHRRWLGASLRAVIPVALAAAAGIGAIGLAFGAWIAAATVVLALIALTARPRLTPRALGLRAAVAVAVGAVAALPTLEQLSKTFGLAKSLSQSNAAAAADPGNLLRPLRALQVLGIWLSGDHRIDPSRHLTATYLLLGVALVGAAAGFAYLLRRGAWIGVAAFVATAVVWWALTKRGTAWTDAKLIVLASPLAVLLSLGGLASLLGRPGRLESSLLVAVAAFGILWSDGLIYHECNLAPTKRFDELASIGKRFSGQRPALFTDFDEYAMVLAAGLDPDQAGFVRHETVLVDGKATTIGAPYGATTDLDTLDWRAVEQYPLIVQRRSPEQSRPPANYKLAWQGTWYDVWRRTWAPKRVLTHLGTYSDGSATGIVKCHDIRQAAAAAGRDGGRLAYAVHDPVVRIDPQKTSRSPNFQGLAAPIGIVFGGPGRLDTAVRLPRGGRWLLWLRGDISRPLSVYVDGRVVGRLGHETGGDRNYLHPLGLSLAAGRHTLSLVRGGGSLAPGDGSPSVLRLIAFEQPLAAAHEVAWLAPSRWRSLCRRRLDWVEADRPPGRA